MSSVDDRIVNMQFNNKQFTQGAAESLKSMDAVENKVASMGKSKGMEQLGSSVEGVKAKFSAMQVAGVTALATITNKAVNAGINFVKSFTLDPITEGFKSYQEQINATRTILANTAQDGVKLKDVTKALNELQTYAQQTVYSFTDMTSNIGTFTAAGVKLKTAVGAIKGLANVAAMSGASAGQAANVMYQMSQAMSAGVVKAQDWISVVNGGMANHSFQQALYETGKAMHTVTDTPAGQTFDQWTKSVGGFKGSLQSGWLTAKVMTQTLKAFTGEYTAKQLQSMGYTKEQAKQLYALGQTATKAATQIKTFDQLTEALKEEVGGAWAAVFKTIFGNVNQATTLFSAIHTTLENAFTGPIWAINGALQSWSKLGGRSDVLKGFKHIFFDIGKAVGAMKLAFHDVFPPGAANTLVKLSDLFRRFTLALVGNKRTWNDLRDIFGGVFAVLHIGVSIVVAIAKGFAAMFAAITKGGSSGGRNILDIVAAIGRLLKAVDSAITSGGWLADAFEVVGTVVGSTIGLAIKMVSYLVRGIANLTRGQGLAGFLKGFSSFQTDVNGFVHNVASALGKIGIPFNSVVKVFSNLSGVVNATGDAISKVVSQASSMGGVVGSLARALGPISGVLKGVGAKALNLGEQGAQIAEGIVGGLLKGLLGSNIAGKISDFATNIVDWIKNALGIHSPATKLIPVGLNIVAGIVVGISKAIGMIAKALGQIVSTTMTLLFKGFNNVDFASLFNALMTGAVLLSIKKFIDTLNSISKPLSSLKSGIKETFEQATSTLKTMQRSVKYKALLQIAIAVGLLTASLVALSFINPKKLATGLGAITIMIGDLVGSMAALVKIDGKGSIALVATAMVQMAISIDLLAVAIAALGALPLKVLEKGMGAVAIMLSVLVKAMSNLAINVRGTTVAAAAMISMAVAINIITVAVAALGNMDFETLGKGIGSIAILIGILVGAMESIGAIGKEGPVAAGAMISMAIAIDMLAAAVLVFGKMSLGSLAKGGLMIAAMVTVLVVAMEAMGEIGPSAAIGAAGLVLIATAVNLLVPALVALSLINWSTFLKGLTMMTLLAVPLAAIGAVATATSTGLLALGAAMALAGVGMLAFGKGFAIMAATGLGGIAVMTAAITAFLGLIPAIAKAFANAFIEFVQVIADASPKLRKAFSTIFKNILGVITDAIPQIVILINKLLDGMYKVLKNYIPKVVKLFTLLISSGLDAIKKLIPKAVNTGLDVLQGILDGIDKHISRMIDKGTDIIIKFIKGTANAAVRITNAAGDAVVTFINGLSDAIDKHAPELRKAGLKLIGSFMNAATFGIAGKIASIGKSVASGLKSLGSKLNPFGRKAGGDIGDTIGRAIVDHISKALVHNVTLAKGIGVNIQGGVLAVGSADNPLTAAQVAQNKIIKQTRQSVYAANAAQEAADRKKVDAQAAKAEAARIKKATDKQLKNKKLTAAQKKAIKKNATDAQKAAAAADAAATKAQNKADAKTSAIQDAQTFRDADSSGRGDIQAAKAVTAANNARDALARSQEEFKQAQKFKDTNKKLYDQLIKDAKKKAAEAAKYSKQASDYQTSAQQYYAQSVQDQIDALEQQVKDQQAATDWQTKFDAADSATQAQMYQDRAAQETDAANTAKDNYAKYLQLAKDTASTDAALAQSYLDQASTYADQAQSDADAAKQDTDAAQQLLNQTTSAATTSGGSVISPSASVLANAAKAVDGFTQSMQQAVNAAQADQGPTQFIQNNYSPTQLDSVTIYRQGKNLVSAAASKLDNGSN